MASEAAEIAKKGWLSHTGFTVMPIHGEDVFTAALRRARELFEMDQPITVGFSGGKDSTCVLMIMLMVARELGRLPLEVAMVDEEVLDPDTIAYSFEVAKWPDINFRWLCIPIKHTLRSQLRTHWYTWDPAERDKWAREIPEGAITLDDLQGYDKEDTGYGDAIAAYYRQYHDWPVRVHVTGIRVEESLNRRRTIMNSGSWLHKHSHEWLTKPIYDWKWQDVWKSIIQNGWPHSVYYDKVWMKGVSMKDQRIGPWGNVASSRETRFYPEFYPDFWAKAIVRLPELRAMARYGSTKMYRARANKPEGITWREFCMQILQSLDDESRVFWLNQIEGYLRRWKNRTTLPFPDEPVKVEGEKTWQSSWRTLAVIIDKNDRFKGRISRDVW